MGKISKAQVREFLNSEVQDEDELVEELFEGREFKTDKELFKALKEKGYEYFANFTLTSSTFGWVYMPDLDEEEKEIYDFFMEQL